jgi:hypothetical protein
MGKIIRMDTHRKQPKSRDLILSHERGTITSDTSADEVATIARVNAVMAAIKKAKAAIRESGDDVEL